MNAFVADSGDPNRGRDKSKDIEILVDGAPVATLYAGQDNPQLVWRVYGPQDARRAKQICEAILSVIGGEVQPVVKHEEPAKKGRPISAAMRDYVSQGKTCDECWSAIVAELGVAADKRSLCRAYFKDFSASKGPLFE